jgi:hypothetical protein
LSLRRLLVEAQRRGLIDDDITDDGRWAAVPAMFIRGAAGEPPVVDASNR